MNNVTTATSFPPLCRHYGQHGQKCEAQEVSWSRTHKQLEAWLRPRPRITGSSAEKLARMGGTSACWVQYITESTEGGAMHHLTRIIHQAEKSTREGTFGAKMILKSTVSQDHHDLQQAHRGVLEPLKIGLMVAIKRTSSSQPPQADKHCFTLEPLRLLIEFTGSARSDARRSTRSKHASKPAPPGTTRATIS
jgi:hypothetical protein